MSIAVPIIRRREGFTIVELLIVIVVIGILAAITIVAYNGIQARGRDAQRKSEVATITKALELYYIDNGSYPLSGCTSSCKVDSDWSTTGDAGWPALSAQLVPKYLSQLPAGPGPNTSAAIYGGGGYDYYSARLNYCNVADRQGYVLAYRLESSSQINTLIGTCTGTPFGPYSGASNYRMLR